MRSKGEEGCVCARVCVCMCVGPFSQQLHDWGRMSVEGHQDSSLTALLFQQRWWQRSMLEICCWVQEVFHPTALQVVEDLYLVCPRRISITSCPPQLPVLHSVHLPDICSRRPESTDFLISAQSIQTWWCIDFTAALTVRAQTPMYFLLWTFWARAHVHV